MLQKNSVNYELRLTRRAKGIRLSVRSGGLFTVSASPRVGLRRIEEFIVEQTDWVLRKIHYFSRYPVQKLLPRQNRKKHFAEHKEKARMLVLERLAHFNQFYGYTWQKVTIRNQRSRWASCSRKGNLNFSYKLALLPSHLSDYVIVHELCHLKEFNHSQKFWDLVAQITPEHKKLRRELRKIGSALL